MATYDYDLFVIGGGSGGVRAARVAARLGARATIAEEFRYGGTCVIRGCVPKKLLVYGSHYGSDFEDAAAYGWRIDGAHFDWKTLIANKDREIDRLNRVYVDLLRGAGVEVRNGRARLLDAHTVECAGQRVSARVILIATGGRPWRRSAPGMEHTITSNEVFHLPELGQKVLIIGGGYIAVEFAGIFRGFGRDVIQLYRGDKLLRGFDDDVRDQVTENLRAHGVDVRTRTNFAGVRRIGDRLEVDLDSGERETVDHVLCAMGRVPNTDDLGLEEVGVELGDAGAVVVDEYSRTTVEHIYAVGDVTNRINLTPVALHEAQAFAETVFGNTPRPVDHRLVASAVFAQPPAATVGLSEEDARAEHGELQVYVSKFRPLKHTLTGRSETTLMKLVVAADSQRIVGAHMVGDDAPEIIQCVAIALKMGATKADFDATIGIHPTAVEELVTMRHFR